MALCREVQPLANQVLKRKGKASVSAPTLSPTVCVLYFPLVKPNQKLKTKNSQRSVYTAEWEARVDLEGN